VVDRRADHRRREAGLPSDRGWVVGVRLLRAAHREPILVRDPDFRRRFWDRAAWGFALGGGEVHVQIQSFTFGSIEIGGVTYQYDVVIDGGQVRKRKKKASKRLRAGFNHTPLSADEDIPWTCRRLVIGTGAHGALPVMDDVTREAKRRKVELVILPTPDAIMILRKGSEQTNAILHVTC
jgi:hypothetical protein